MRRHADECLLVQEEVVAMTPQPDARVASKSWMEREPHRGGFADSALLALPGLDRVRAGIAGHAPLPPIHHLFGLRPVSVGPVSATFAVPASPWLCSDAGVFHSGAAALVADAALAVSIQVTLGPGAMVATSDLSFNFLRPAARITGGVDPPLVSLGWSAFGRVTEPGLTLSSPADACCLDNDPSAWLGHPSGTPNRSGGVTY
jgi:hypothetical protein